MNDLEAACTDVVKRREGFWMDGLSSRSLANDGSDFRLERAADFIRDVQGTVFSDVAELQAEIRDACNVAYQLEDGYKSYDAGKPDSDLEEGCRAVANLIVSKVEYDTQKSLHTLRDGAGTIVGRASDWREACAPERRDLAQKQGRLRALRNQFNRAMAIQDDEEGRGLLKAMEKQKQEQATAAALERERQAAAAAAAAAAADERRLPTDAELERAGWKQNYGILVSGEEANRRRAEALEVAFQGFDPAAVNPNNPRHPDHPKRKAACAAVLPLVQHLFKFLSCF